MGILSRKPIHELVPDGEAKLCADPPGVNRRAVHQQLFGAAVQFFQKHLE